jgi:hypothetical protein
LKDSFASGDVRGYKEGNHQPPTSRMPKNRKIHDWSKRLVQQLNSAGIRATDVTCSRSKNGFYSAYFGVPGLGEVRVSDHPLVRNISTADISISSPASYIDLAKAFVFKHNQATGSNLTVIDRHPYIMDTTAGAELIAAIEADRIAREAAREALIKYEGRRSEWWSEQIAASGLKGTPKEIKFQLKSRGVRYPGDVENDE